MRALVLTLLLATAAAPAVAAPFAAVDAPAAGPARDCINQRLIRDFKAAGDRTILFKTRDGQTWRNDLPASCIGLNRGEVAYKHQSPINRLCSGEIVQLYERTTGFEYGNCGLGKFTPLVSPK